MSKTFVKQAARMCSQAFRDLIQAIEMTGLLFRSSSERTITQNEADVSE